MSLEKLKLPLITKEDPAMESYREDTMMRGNPDALLRARDLQDIQEAVRFCAAEKIPITFCGSQTSMTGSSVAMEGLLISTEKLERVKDIGNRYAIAEPGITIANLKKEVAEEGWFYPPAPTSQEDARLGATISTNATGEDSYQYGTTRRYVREIKVLLADGTLKTFSRKSGENIPDELSRAGYFSNAENPIDLLIGSEGTLGFIYEVTVDLTPLPPHYFSALAPFPNRESAIEMIQKIATEKKLQARALEFIDEGALHFMQQHPAFPEDLKKSKALLYFKQEYTDESELEKILNDWLTILPDENIFLAKTERQKEEIRLWRHHIPLKVNEEYRRFWIQGGGKVGSDWWVPVNKISEMMAHVYKSGEAAQITFFAFAHLGQGHPHVDYLCKTPEEKITAKKLLEESCRKAVALGGGVSAEHGIGKLHHNLLSIQWPKQKIEQMRRVKQEWDPHYLFGRGNILKPQKK